MSEDDKRGIRTAGNILNEADPEKIWEIFKIKITTAATK